MNKTGLHHLYLDFDGTITDKKGDISKMAIMMLEEIGDKFLRTIATGRTAGSFMQKVTADFPIDYLIFSTGAGIMDWQTKEIISCSIFDEEQTRIIEKLLRQMKISFSIHHPIPHNHKFEYFCGETEVADFSRYLRLHRGDGEEYRQGIIQSTQFLIITDDNDFDLGKFETLSSFANVFKLSSPIDHLTTWIEILPKNVSKSLAAEKLIQILGDNPKSTIAIGNDFNDEDLIAWADVGYFVDSAAEKLRKKYFVLPFTGAESVGLYLKDFYLSL